MDGRRQSRLSSLLVSALLEEVLGLLCLRPLHPRTAVPTGGVVQLSQPLQVEFGFLEDLDFADEDVLEGEDGLAGLLDLLADRLGDEFPDKVPELHFAGLTGHDLDHLPPDLPNLRRTRIARRLGLIRPPVSESDAEHAQEVSVGSLDVDVGLDERVPLAHQAADLVAGEIHAVEIRQAVLALDFLAAELHLAEGHILRVGVEVSQGDLKHATTQTVTRQLCPC
mmetsp:Transcript_19323/g.46682  ORF Transcript_19323/g.46682 Transcript_19323/m.46682 type:complete len:224 (-) Transcript_19323:186-857(-)